MLRTHSLLQKVAVATIVPVVVLGFVLQRAIQHQVRARALDQAVGSAGLIATLGVQPQLTTFDLRKGLTAEQIAQLDRALSAPSLDGQLVRIKIWCGSRSGTRTAESSTPTTTP